MRPAIVLSRVLLRSRRASCVFSRLIRQNHSIAWRWAASGTREDYKTGRLCGRYFLATVGKLLAKNAPLPRQTPKIVVPGPVVVPPAPVANDAHVPVVTDAPQANDTTFDNEDLA